MKLNARKHLTLVVAVGVLGFIGAGQFLPNSLIVFGIFGAVFFTFAKEMDKGIPIDLIGSILAVVQWLLGPVLSYQLDVSVDRYQMYVAEEAYFAFAIPATSAFICGLLLLSNRGEELRVLRERDGRDDFKIGMMLLILSVGSEFARPFAPGTLAFFFHMLSQLRYIAAIYFILSTHRFKWLLIVVSLSQLFIRTAEQAMFHDLILWGSLIACYWWIIKPRTLPVKVAFLVFGVICVSSIQVVKREYRDAAWAGENPSFALVAYDMLVERSAFTNRDTIENAIVRMNQGWIISAVIRHVPSREPFAGGETIREAIIASMLPRFLAPNKKEAGGQVNFRRFTGMTLADSTSMGISPLGEAYANFGSGGGTVFMFVWGLAFGTGIGAVRNYGRRDPTFLIWIPLIFYQAVKAETEIVVVFNQLVKGSVVAIACYYAIHHIWLKNSGRVLGDPREHDIVPTGGLADIQRH